jgi:hypothetical protein
VGEVIETLPPLHVGQGRHAAGISVFPVWTEAPEVHGLYTANQTGITAAERDGSPVVNELVLTNPSAQPVLVLAGELFEGGWQHRALNQDLVILSGRHIVTNVSCVEQGRWHGHRDQVHRSRRASVMVRAAQATSPDASRQTAVRDRVSRYDAAFGASDTSSYVDHLDRRGARVRRGASTPITPELSRPLAGQRGVIIGLAGQPAILELFPSTDALASHLPALIEAVSVDGALAPPIPTPGRRARRLVERLERLHLQVDPTTDAGDGRAVAGHTAYHRAAGVVWRDQLAHAAVFNARHPLLAA